MPANRSTNPREQVLDLLKEDHKHVKKHFREFEKMDPERDPQACHALAQRVCAELEVHATLEEELFYPAARAALQSEEGQELLDEAEVEHASMKMLIEELKTMRPEDAKFKAHFIVLAEYVKHHVKEEESEMFEKLGRTKVDWERLLQDMLDRQQELKAEKGLSDLNEPDIEHAMHGSTRRSGAGSRTSRRS
jgi:replicative superfamily II helicase